MDSKPTSVGPNLRCIAANIFLSIIVIKATDNKIGTTTLNILLKFNKLNIILSAVNGLYAHIPSELLLILYKDILEFSVKNFVFIC